MEKPRALNSNRRVYYFLKAIDYKAVNFLSREKIFEPVKLGEFISNDSKELIEVACNYDGDNLEKFLKQYKNSKLLGLYIELRKSLFRATYYIYKWARNG